MTPETQPARREMAAEDLARLAEAMRLLEQDTFSDVLLARIGRFAEGGLGALRRFLPETYRREATVLLEAALRQAFDQVLLTVDRGGGVTGHTWLDRPLGARWTHRAAAIASGALGGAAGLGGAVIELPVTTLILMRAVAQIAAQQGEDLASEEAKLECLKVFALAGGPSGAAPDAGYYAVRLALATAAPRLAERGLPALLPRLVSRVAERFSAPVAAKLGAEAAPGAGAVTGALINAAFMDHLQRRALGHFRVRALERRYGRDLVRASYAGLWAEARRSG